MNAQQRAHRPINLRNETCCYCGKPFDVSLVATRDHVVGRRFVPSGKLDRCWNLIIHACSPCNVRKSDLEDDISAISMQPGPLGDFAADDKVLIEEAIRKGARSRSRLTGKPVADSSEELTFGGALAPGATFSFTTIGPPQVYESRAWELARLQVSAFFYLLTYDQVSKRGLFWPGAFNPFPLSPQHDWGNTRNIVFMQTVSIWEPRFIGTTASGYFRIAIRQKADTPLWSWALEWNRRFRLIGFFGDYEAALAVSKGIPEPKMHVAAQNGDRVVRMRREVPLADDDDILFQQVVDDNTLKMTSPDHAG